ncbi:MAG TPA: discoidin domain-containing protein, partial [Pirellulaceae bacterium]
MRCDRSALSRVYALLTLGVIVIGNAQAETLDDFSSLKHWRVLAADGVRGELALARGPEGKGTCLRLDFEFVTGGGYCIVQRDIELPLPENYEFTYLCRAAVGTPDNNLEFKLLDKPGENVWWVNRRALTFPTTWQRFVNKRRHFEFAWGPLAGKPLKEVGKLELVIASHEGGNGSVYFDELTFRPLEPPAPYLGTPDPRASSSLSEQHSAAAAWDDDETTSWASSPSSRLQSESLTVDFGVPREFG